MSPDVRTWMTPDPMTIDVGASALEAVSVMVDRGIRHLPVIERRRLVGIVSLSDLRAALPVPIDLRRSIETSERELLRGYGVAELMTYLPEVVSPETSLEEAADRLARRRIGCLPVVDAAGSVVGILSSTDALRALATAPSERPRSATEARAREIIDLVRALRAERDRVQDEIVRRGRDEQEIDEHLQETGGVDLEDRGELRTELGTAVPLLERSSRRLEAIEQALARAADGTLARCTDCGGDIPLARLRALPGTTRCVACARLKER